MGIIDTAIDTAVPIPAPPGPNSAPPGPTRTRVLVATALLALLALAGNHFSLSLLFGVDVLFGSIAVLLALVWLGTWPGLLVALVGGACTWFLWDHPYALIILVGEAAAVAWHRERARRRGRDAPPLAVSVTLYWFLIGIPLVLLCYHIGLGMGWPQTLLVAVKQALNGILDAALAGLVLLAAGALGRRRCAVPVAQVLFSVLLFSLLLPSLLITVWQSRDLKDHLEAEQAERLLLFTRLAVAHLESRRHPDGLGAADLEAEREHLNRFLGENLPAGSDPRVRWSAPPGPTPAAAAGADLGRRPQQGIAIPTGTAGLEIILPSGRLPSRMTLWRGARYRLEIPAALSLPGDPLAVEFNAAPLIDRLQETLTRLLLALLALAGLGVALAWALSRQLVRPLQQLLEVTAALPAAIRDSRSWPVPEPGRLREPGQLADAVAAMLGSLSASFRALAQENLESMRLRRRLSNIIAGTRVGTWEWEVQTGVTVVNERWAEIVGYQLAELAPLSIQTWIDLTHPDDLQRSLALAQAHFRGESEGYECELRMRHRDGHWVWVLDQGRVMEWDAAGAPRLMSGTHQDITERKHAESALAQRESMVDELLALAVRLVGVPDQGLDTLTTEAIERIGRFAHADRSYVALLDEAAGTLTNTREWTAPGVAPGMAQHQSIPVADLPELMLQLRLGEPVVFPRVTDMPADWSRERAICVARGTASLLMAPLAVGEVLLGCVGLDAVRAPRDWASVQIRFLQVFASILAGVMDRAHATEDLRASNARYEQLARQSRSMSWEIDPQGRYTYISPVCEQVLGYRAEELIGHHFYALLPAEDRAAVKAAAFAIMERREPIRDFDRLCLGVHDWRVWLMSSGAPLFAPDGTFLGYRGIDTDITDRHLAQDLIRESEERLSAVFENAPIGMALIAPDRRFTLVNRALAAFLGRSTEELTGMRIDDVTQPDDLDLNLSLFTQLQAGRQSTYRITKHYLRPDGRVVWGDVRVSLLPSRPGTPPTPLAMIEDITDLHAATDRQRALEDALTRYAAQLEDLVDLINRALPSADKDRALLGLGCRTLGATAAVLGLVEGDGGHRVLSAIPEEGADGPAPAMLQAVLAEILAQRGTLCVLGAERLPGAAVAAGLRSCIGLACDAPRPDGQTETLVLSLWGTQAALELGEPQRQLIRLIAQRMAAERYQEQIQRDLVASRERETIGHLASGIAHDFNNLLGVIDANIYFLESGLPGADTDPEIRQVLEETQSALGQAKVITSGMLSLSRAGGVPLEPVDLEQTVAELVRILRQVLPPGIHLTVAIPPGLKACTNAGFLQAALLNLALNARDAMPAGGNLHIEAAPVTWTDDLPLAVGTPPPMDRVELRVTDTGSGIAPAILPNIFDPLFSTKAKQRGHGLGLFMVKEFINRSGAALAVASHPGCGASFRLLLSAVSAPTPLPDPPPSPPAGGAAAGEGSDALPPGLRVLVVDDDPRVREAVARLLGLEGVELGQAEHGQAALAVLAQDPGFDLVLSDIAMPTLDGIGLYRHLARERPELPVILMTGQDSTLANTDDLPERPLVLRKPLDPAALRAAIRARVQPAR